MFVVTKAHEEFYNDELSDAPGSNLVVQPANRGTGVAIATAVLQILQHDRDAIVAFFPSDHYFADVAVFSSDSRMGDHTGDTTAGIADSGWRPAPMA